MYFIQEKRKAFTLIELLVVIAIIGLLASIVLASLESARAKGRDAKRLQDLNQLQVALEMYHSTYGCYPKSTNDPNSNSTLTNPCPTGPSGIYSWNCKTHANSHFDVSLAVLVDAGFIPSVPEDPINKSKDKNYCYHYTSQNNPPVSQWSCDSVARDAFPYAIIFPQKKVILI